MQKTFFLWLLLFLLYAKASSQSNSYTDSLRQKIESANKDTNKVNLLINLTWSYLFINPDSTIIMAKEARDLASELNYSEGEGVALTALGEALHTTGDFPQALEALFNALRISREIKNKEIESDCLDFIGIAYVDLGEYRLGLNYLYQAKEMNDKFPLKAIKRMTGYRMSNIGHAYEKLGKPDSALVFQQQAQILSQNLPPGPESALILTRLGVIQADLGNQAQALSYYRDAVQIGDVLNLGSAQYRLAELFYTLHQPDSSLHYARLAFINNQRAVEKQWVLETSNLLVKLYKEKNNIDSAFHYQKVSLALKDSLFGPEKFHKLQLLAINEEQRQQEIVQKQKEIQQENERFENKIKIFSLLAIVGVFLFLAIILYRNNLQKKKANGVLGKTLSTLKATQSELIQSEKMASLGELTAGIAHEIQNPLNFVNNFSEVNTELIEEMKTELRAGNNEQAIAIADDIKENEQKINHHGKRADAIVKGMLQHSQASTGTKQPTNINALADEYLRLSYHGLRSKDKSFDATLKTDFDESISNINVIPQDIGRVLLNLYNNAFYDANEKRKIADENYKPLVSVSTKRINDKVEIKVSDIGNGIPQNIVDKIFQPFFTTKPTGQGTGLGLSLSYDIIKGHGGEIKVDTKEGEGSEFTIQLKV